MIRALAIPLLICLMVSPVRALAQPGPSHVEQTGVAPDGPPSESDLAYENRIRASVAAAQGLQGPLDGGWTLYDGAGQSIYVFQFVDPAGGRGPLEAVWRDPHRSAGAGHIGVVDDVQRAGAVLTLSFAPYVGATTVRIELQAGADGAWSGKMTNAAGPAPVALRRN